LTQNLALLPTLLPMISALVMLFWSKNIKGQKVVAFVFFLLMLLLSSFILFKTAHGEILVTFLGGWKAPYGITLAIDLFSSLMLTSVSLVFFTTTLFGFGEGCATKTHFMRLPLIFLLQTGVNLSLTTADFFNLFVAFEVMLSSSYALFAIETNAEKKKAVYTYIITNIVGSFLFLANSAMVYGYTGNLNMASLSVQIETLGKEPIILAISLLTLIMFGIKSGMFPFYFWLPESYPQVPSSIAALFSGTLTKVGLYAFIRLFITILPKDIPYVYELLLILSALTMFLGVIGAVSKSTIKGILCYHIVSQMGYMVLAVAFLTPAALSAGIFLALHNMVVKTSLILIGGVVILCMRSDNLEKVAGFAAQFPIFAVFFFLQAASLAGLPPFSGFWGKFLLFFEGIELKHYIFIFVAIVTSFFTLFSMMKIWTRAFLGEKTGVFKKPPHGMKRLVFSTGMLVIVALFMAIYAQGTLTLTEKAAFQLFDKQAYHRAILGD